MNTGSSLGESGLNQARVHVTRNNNGLDLAGGEIEAVNHKDRWTSAWSRTHRHETSKSQTQRGLGRDG